MEQNQWGQGCSACSGDAEKRRFQICHDIDKSTGDKGWRCLGIQENDGIMQTWRCGIYPLFWTWTADDGCA